MQNSAPHSRRRPSRVISFDPGYERLGIAVIDRNEKRDILLFSDCVRTSKKDPFSERLLQLGIAVEKVINAYTPDAAALETVFFENNAKTAMQVAAVRGVLAYLAGKNDLSLWEYTPLEVKAAVTGWGQSDKNALALMVPRLITLPQKDRLDDEIDAIAVGLTCIAMTRTVAAEKA